MYLDYFGLRQRPFLISPDPAFLYPSGSHREALAHLGYGLEREGGFVLLTGEVGTGKTTLCRLLIEQLPPSFRLAYILNARLDSGGVLAGICKELGIDLPPAADDRLCVERLHDNLLAAHGEGRQTLVIIEEAQNLDPAVLETLRLLTNLETASAKLLHILLIGQPELLDTLRRPDLRQLNQRVVSRCHLGPLSLTDTRPYLDHRVRVAGCERGLFSPRAARRIHRRTQGIPRLINLLAERALLGAYAEQRRQVSAGVVKRAAREVLDMPVAPRAPGLAWRGLAGAAVLVAGAAALGYGWFGASLPGPGPSMAGSLDRAAVPGVAGSGPASAPAPAEPPPGEGVFARWLAPWGIQGAARSVDEACGVALRWGLACESLRGLGAEALLALDQPLLVTLFNDSEGLDFYLADGAVQGTVSLVNAAGVRRLTRPEFAARWSGDGWLLWQPPASYRQPLLPGARDPQLLPAVVDALVARGYLAAPLVTGGDYGAFLVEQVRSFQRDRGLAADGVLGVHTLVALGVGGLTEVAPAPEGAGGPRAVDPPPLASAEQR